MAEPADRDSFISVMPDEPRRSIKALPILLVAGGALIAAQAAAWLWFRAHQDEADAQTRDRLQPRQ